MDEMDFEWQHLILIKELLNILLRIIFFTDW